MQMHTHHIHTQSHTHTIYTQRHTPHTCIPHTHRNTQLHTYSLTHTVTQVYTHTHSHTHIPHTQVHTHTHRVTHIPHTHSHIYMPHTHTITHINIVSHTTCTNTYTPHSHTPHTYIQTPHYTHTYTHTHWLYDNDSHTEERWSLHNWQLLCIFFRREILPPSHTIHKNPYWIDGWTKEEKTQQQNGKLHPCRLSWFLCRKRCVVLLDFDVFMVFASCEKWVIFVIWFLVSFIMHVRFSFLTRNEANSTSLIQSVRPLRSSREKHASGKH